KLDACHKVLHRPILADPLAIVRQPPAVELLDLLLCLFRRIRIDAAFTRFAFLLDKFFRGLHGHDDLLRAHARNQLGKTLETTVKLSAALGVSQMSREPAAINSHGVCDTFILKTATLPASHLA